MSIRDGPKQFQVESTVPHGVICSCQVQKHYPILLIVLKAVFDVLCVSSVTWSTVDRPRRKPACSRGSCGSTTGSMRLCINLSRILNGTQSSEMGLYDLGSCAGLFGFGRATAVARRQVFGNFDLRKHDVKNEHSQAVVFALW